MIYDLKFIRKAKEEITEAYNYYENRKPGLGEKFLEHLDTYFERITANPEQFPPKNDFVSGSLYSKISFPDHFRNQE